jgi:uncharacterized protein YkwD
MSLRPAQMKSPALAGLLTLALLLSTAPVRADAPSPTLGEPASQLAADEPTGYLPLFTGCTRVDVPPQNADYEQRVVELVNLERANVGLPPLKLNEDLGYSARYHAKDMQDENYFNHDSYDGSTLVCNWGQRISLFYSNWWALGENIAVGYDTPESVMSEEGWMGSAGHKSNILNTNYREIGVGYYHSYWVQDFGARNGVYPLIINDEAAQTDTPAVELYLYAPSVSGMQMRFSNDGANWSAWKPYSARTQWTLPTGNGIKTVYSQLNANGVTYTSSDAIMEIWPELGNLPASILFIYDQSQSRMIPENLTLQPLNTGTQAVLSWQAQAADTWISPQSGSGNTPNGNFTFAPGGNPLFITGDYTTTLTVTVTSPAQVINSPWPITVHLAVVEALDEHVFLPVIRR